MPCELEILFVLVTCGFLEVLLIEADHESVAVFDFLR